MPKIILLLLFTTCTYLLCSQDYEVRSSFGAMHYLGDLAPLSSDLSASRPHIASKVSYNLSFNEMVTYYSSLVVGKVSANDENSNNLQRKNRNLSFESNIYEIGIGLEISLVSAFPKFDKYGIDIFLTGGVSTFHMNPQGFIDNRWVDLQPLGTEGQGELRYEDHFKSKYKLWQLAFPFGMGIGFKLSDRYAIGLEFAPRFLLTDYLDDVSSIYMDTKLQTELQGSLTARLANRTGSDVSFNTIRGDSRDKDWYVYNSFTFIMALANMIPSKKARK